MPILVVEIAQAIPVLVVFVGHPLVGKILLHGVQSIQAGVNLAVNALPNMKVEVTQMRRIKTAMDLMILVYGKLTI